MSQVTELFARAHPPLDNGITFPVLDDVMVEFVTSGEVERDVKGMTPKERLWLHTRAASIGLKTETIDRDKGTMRISRPAGWELPASPIEVVKHDKRSERQKRMDAWRTECDECGKELDAYDALYHWSGMGPMCEECINRDIELEGLKWEEKASFWY